MQKGRNFYFTVAQMYTFKILYLAIIEYGCILICFVAVCPKSTAMVMEGRSVHQTTFFLATDPGGLELEPGPVPYFRGD